MLNMFLFNCITTQFASDKIVGRGGVNKKGILRADKSINLMCSIVSEKSFNTQISYSLI